VTWHGGDGLWGLQPNLGGLFARKEGSARGIHSYVCMGLGCGRRASEGYMTGRAGEVDTGRMNTNRTAGDMNE